MATELKLGQKSLYETNFVGWVETNLAQLRSQNYDSVDWVNLLEEIADMSRRERKSLKSNLIVILIHLLKWQYQPNARSGSWRGSRRRIKDDLKESPSLVPYVLEIFDECYANAQKQAADETGLPLSTFP